MVHWEVNSDACHFAMNCAIGSSIVWLLGTITLRLHRAYSPHQRYNLLLCACLAGLLVPISQFALARTEVSVWQPYTIPVSYALDSATRWCCCVWLTITTILLTRLLFGFVVLHFFRQSLAETDDRRLEALMHSAARHVGLPHPVPIAVTPFRLGPMVVGIRSPMIVVSKELLRLLPDQQLLCVLVHECEHVRRHDVLTSTLQQIATCFYWWNPLCILATRQMEFLRERACDDRVASLPDGAGHYAKSLLRVAEWTTKRQGLFLPMVALATGCHDLVRRIQRLGTAQSGRQNTRFRQAALLSVTLLSLVLVGGLPLLRPPTRFASLEISGADTVPGSHTIGGSQVLADGNLMYFRLETPTRDLGSEIASLFSTHRLDESHGLIVDMRQQQTFSGPEHWSHLVDGQRTDVEPVDKYPKIVLLVDSENATSTTVRSALADCNLPTVILAGDCDQVEHQHQLGEKPPTGTGNDDQLQLAINMLSPV